MCIKLIKKENLETRDFGSDLTLQILLDKEVGAKSLDLGIVNIPPNGKTAMHCREFEEVIYMLSGCGKVKTEDGKEYVLNEGDCVLIPEGIMHCHANESDKPLKQLYIFAPQSNKYIQKSLRDLPVIE